jgi:hypothetical protein
MLAHIDVVEARREDWARDPFTLVEEGGYFYGRGTTDMKAQAAVWVDNLVRYREQNFKPKRDIKLALTCGEETSSALNGAGWLVQNARDAIDAEFALTEGVTASGCSEGTSPWKYWPRRKCPKLLFEVTNAGRPQFAPGPDNAFAHLVRAVDRVSHYEFLVQLDDANRAYFSGMSRSTAANKGSDGCIVADDPIHRSYQVLDRNMNWHAMLRTTCVATMLSTVTRPTHCRSGPQPTLTAEFPCLARKCFAQLVKSPTILRSRCESRRFADRQPVRRRDTANTQAGMRPWQRAVAGDSVIQLEPVLPTHSFSIQPAYRPGNRVFTDPWRTSARSERPDPRTVGA